MNKPIRKWWILTAMCLLTVMLNLDVTAINIAVPVIAHEFSASLANMQWVINAYVLLSAMFQIFGGRLGDTYGHRKIFLIGTIIFVLASAGCGISVNEEMLIAFRTIQGFALGIAYPMTIVLTFAAFPKSQQGYALSFIVGTMGVFLAIGPPVGGLFVDYLNWRWIFYINVPIGILTFILAYIFCPPHKAAEKKYIDYKGAIFLMIGLLGILVAINQVQVWGFASIAFIVTFFLGLAFLFFLYFIERKQSYPIINFHLFRIRNFTLNNIIRIISQLVFIPVLFFIPLYLQNISGTSPLYSGLLMLFLTVIIAILSPIAGKWIDAVGDKLPNISSMFIFAVGCFLFYFITLELNLWVLGIGLFLIGTATGVNFVSTTTGAISSTDEKHHGVATGIFFTIAWMGCGMGVALMGTIIALSSNSYLLEQLSTINYSFSSAQTQLLERVSQGISSHSVLQGQFPEEILSQVTELTSTSFLHGLHLSMLIWMSLALLGFVLSLFLKKIIPKEKSPVEMI